MSTDRSWSFETADVFDKEGGVTGSQGIELVFPPRALVSEKAITIKRLSSGEIPPFSDPELASIDLAWDIGPQSINLMKGVSVKISYNLGNIGTKNPEKLALYFNDGSQWICIGGTVDTASGLLTAQISKMGRYAVVEDNKTYSGKNSELKIDCQPRVFSPDNFDELCISFELASPATMTVRVYDMARRLIRTVNENYDGNPGNNTLFWDGKTETGEKTVDGMYILSIEFKEDGKTILKTRPFVVRR